ncbi:MAG: alpha/beta hydrolase [Calditrichaceae bacterium]|nr:alpha/beta hydrolase [Calditrichaceae bacterium]MBN2707585.1 alpha/beta hydrolase [Calditrichaceae bacterium]RQV97775.1 MAG: alpha/beta hydrolase [Calditrichota bacterium]
MQSIRSKLVLWLIRNRHLLKFKLKKEVVDENFSVERFRQDVYKTTSKMKMPKGIHSESFIINQIQAEWIIPEHPLQGKVLLHIHGGGFISGSCNTHRTIVAKFTLGTQLKSLLFDYRLAPEHPFPAALDDCIEVYQWLLENGYKSSDIVIGGESAGGTLTLVLLLALKEKHIDLPRAAFSISPVTDLRCLADSFVYNAKNDIAPYGSWDIWTKYYIANNDPKLPLLSPLFGNYEDITPIHITVGTHEIHLDDCINVAQKAKEQGVDVILSKWPKMVHAFPLFSPLFPEAKKALTDICQFAVMQFDS